MKKYFLFLLLMSIGANSYAATVSGGDAASQAAADTVVDIVFAIDTSGSMSDEASAISNAINNAVQNLQCPNIDVWVNARLTGIGSTWGGTLFDETAQSVLNGVGAAITMNHVEDNGPVVFDFATANTAYYVDPTNAGQIYAKAIVTIGDEGLENGEPMNQADYDSGKAANDIAVANGIKVFSLLGNNPVAGASAVFQALAEGNATLGGHVFNDTGGSFTTTTSATPFEEVLEKVFCQAAVPPPPPPATIPTLSEWSLILLSIMLALISWLGIGRGRQN